MVVIITQEMRRAAVQISVLDDRRKFMKIRRKLFGHTFRPSSATWEWEMHGTEQDKKSDLESIYSKAPSYTV